MGIKRGRPAPGEHRPLTCNEGDVAGIDTVDCFTVRVTADDQVQLWRQTKASPAYMAFGSSSFQVEQLVRFWGRRPSEPIHRPDGKHHKSPQVQPRRLVLRTEKANTTNREIDHLDCGHAIPRPKWDRVGKRRTCPKCPPQDRAKVGRRHHAPQTGCAESVSS